MLHRSQQHFLCSYCAGSWSVSWKSVPWIGMDNKLLASQLNCPSEHLRKEKKRKKSFIELYRCTGFPLNNVSPCLRGMKQWMTHWKMSCVLPSHYHSVLPYPCSAHASFGLYCPHQCIPVFSFPLLSLPLHVPNRTFLLHCSARFVLSPPFPRLRMGSSVLALLHKLS